MKINYKQQARFLWVLISVAILFFRFDYCFEARGCYAAGDEMLFLMFLGSFPGSLLYLAFLGLTFNSTDVHAPLPYFLLWGGAFVTGYLQWFWFLPRLLRGTRMTTLGLVQGRASTIDSQGSTERQARNRRRKRRLKGCRVIHFDEMGRTPLERAINRAVDSSQ